MGYFPLFLGRERRAFQKMSISMFVVGDTEVVDDS